MFFDNARNIDLLVNYKCLCTHGITSNRLHVILCLLLAFLMILRKQPRCENKALQILAAASLAMVTSNLNARGGYIDITVNDGSPSSNYGTDPRAGIGESGEVEVGCVSNATWDLRAMAFDVNTNSLLVVSGFNPLALNDGTGARLDDLETPRQSDRVVNSSNPSANRKYFHATS